MLKSFFEIGCKKELFDGLKIAQEKELCEEYIACFKKHCKVVRG
jgi:hypothetical protein